MRKSGLLSLVIMVCLILVTSVCNASPSLEKYPDPRETVIKAFQNLDQYKNYHVSMELPVSVQLEGGSIGDVFIKSEIDIQTQPEVCKNLITYNFDMDAIHVEDSAVLYTENVESKYTIYYKLKKEWDSMSMKSPAAQPDLQSQNPGNFKKVITGAIPLSETSDKKVFKVIINGMYLKEYFQGMKHKVEELQLHPSDSVLDNIVDMKFTVTIDKNTNTVSQVEGNLSDLLSAVAYEISQSKRGSEETRQSLAGMLNSAKLSAKVTFSQFNTVDEIVIPLEAKNAARQNESKANDLEKQQVTN
jgi:hypothetical protein